MFGFDFTCNEIYVLRTAYKTNRSSLDFVLAVYQNARNAHKFEIYSSEH